MQIIRIRILSVFKPVFTPYIDLNGFSLYTDMPYLICKIVRILYFRKQGLKTDPNSIYQWIRNWIT